MYHSHSKIIRMQIIMKTKFNKLIQKQKANTIIYKKTHNSITNQERFRLSKNINKAMKVSMRTNNKITGINSILGMGNKRKNSKWDMYHSNLIDKLVYII